MLQRLYGHKEEDRDKKSSQLEKAVLIFTPAIFSKIYGFFYVANPL